MGDSEPVDESSNIPDRETCQKLTEEFARITGTDEALAQFFLQDRDWKLERSVNDYFEQLQHEERNFNPIHQGTPSNGLYQPTNDDAMATSLLVDKKVDFAYITNSALDVAMKYFSETNEPGIFKLITWNIDGLDQCNVINRTKGVYRTIRAEQPDVVFFQEIIPQTYTLLEEKLPNYEFIASNNIGYFTIMLVKKNTVQIQDSRVVPFYTSKMNRSLLIVKAKFQDIPLALITSHLESTKEHAKERKNQLIKAFSTMQENDPSLNVIFGGDLNLRDTELDEAGGIPNGIQDLWETCGSRPECRYTWDTSRNCNSEYGSKFKPRCRFDRLYFRKMLTKPRLIPRHFGLIGLEKLKSCQRFPSDHWGIRCIFDLDKE